MDKLRERWLGLGSWISKSTKKLIGRIPVCNTEDHDRFIRLQEKSGRYTAKTRYQMLKAEENKKVIGGPSSHQIDKKDMEKNMEIKGIE